MKSTAKMHQVLKHPTILRDFIFLTVAEICDKIHTFAVSQFSDDNLFSTVGGRQDLIFLISIRSMSRQVQAALIGYGVVL